MNQHLGLKKTSEIGRQTGVMRSLLAFEKEFQLLIQSYMACFTKYLIRVSVLFALLLTALPEVKAQGGPGGPGGGTYSVSGDGTAIVNDSKTYSITGSNVGSVVWSVTSGVGTIIGSNTNNTVTITWNTAATGYVSALVTPVGGNQNPATDRQVIVSNPPPVAPSAPNFLNMSGLNQCGQTILSYSNTPSGETWYWQTTSTNKATTHTGNYTVTSPGTYYLRAKDNAPSGIWSTTATPIVVTIDEVPPAPTANQETNRATTSFRANWSTASGASSYRLDVANNSSFSSMVSGFNDKSVSGTYATVSGLTPGKNYYYRLRARSSDGCNSVNSGTITANTTISVPAVSQESNQASTSFRANWSSVTGAVSYRLDVANNSSFSSMVSGYNNKSVSGNYQTVTGLSLGNTYYYRLRAVGANITSANSSVITANTTVSAPVATQETSNADGSFTANWNAIAGVSNYRIDISENSSFSSFIGGYNNFEIPPAITSLAVPGLSPGKDYYYRLRAQGGSITSGNSTVITAHTTISPPSASQESSRTTTSFRVNWSAAPGVSSYRLDISENSAFSSFITGYSNKSVSGTNQTVTGLAPGKNYYYRLRSQGPNRVSSNSNVITANTSINSPVAAQESSKTNTSFRANWSAASGATSYLLYVSENSAFSSYLSGYNGKTISGSSTINHTISGLVAGKNYYYRLKAKGPSLNSGYSGTITANTTISAPAVSQESNKTATSFRANWSAVAGVSNFLLYVSENSSFSSHLSGYNGKSVTGTNHTITGLAVGKNYYYRLKSDGPTDSGYSSTITANTIVTAPVATQETNNADGSFRANWNAVTGVSNYRIDISSNSAFSSFIGGYNNFEVPPALTNLVVPGLAQGTDYYYRLRSEGGSIASGNSNVITAHTTISPPSASEETNRTTTSFRVNWSSATGVSSYRLDISENSSFSSYISGYQNKSVTGTNFTVTGLAPGKNYYYRLRSVGPNRTSANSNVITANTSISTPVVAQESNKTNTSFRANWSAASGATSYLLYVSENSAFSSYLSGYNGKTISGGSTINHTISGLVAGKNYYYRLKAKGPSLNSGYSSTITANTTISAPVASQESNKTATSFRANWSAVAGVSNFFLYVSENSGFTSHLSGFNGKSVTGTNYTVTGLTVGKNYYYRLKSDGPTDSGYSSVITANTIVSVPVATQETSNANGSFTANWNAVAGVSNYRMDISENSSFSSFIAGYDNFQLPPVVTSMAVPGLLPGKDYYYRLRAQGGSITSGNSNVITAHTTISPPLANQESSRTTTSFRANWSAAPGVSSYRLDISENSTFSSFITGYSNKSVSGTYQTVTGLASGKNYYYRLRSQGPNRVSSNSNVITANTSIDSPVAAQESNKTNTSFQANWSAASGATGYLLYVSENSAFSSHLSGYNGKTISGGSTINHTISGLVVGGSYYYRLKAQGPSVNSGYSNTITANTTVGSPVATAATNLNTHYFQANWNAVSGASNYLFDLSTDSLFATFVAEYHDFEVPPTNSLTILGLEPGRVYYYRLRAESPSYTSGYSNTITTNTRMTVPSGLAATNQTHISFQANWVALAGATYYEMDVSTSTDFTEIVGTYNNLTGTFRTVSGLTPGRDYYYQLRAVSADGIVSANSPYIGANTTIGAPVLYTASNITSTSFQANWGPIAAATGGYILQVSEEIDFSSLVIGYDSLLISGQSTTSYEVTGLTPGKNYYYRVKSVGDDYASDYPQPILVVVPIDAPEVRAASNITHNSFQAHWDTVEGVEGFIFQASTQSNFNTFVPGFESMSLDKFTTTQSVTGLTDGGGYFYRVRAIGEDHVSEFSLVEAVGLEIEAPVLTVNSPTKGSLLTSWSPVVGAVAYELDVSENVNFSSFVLGNEKRLINGSNTQLEVTGLDAGKYYHFRLRAVGTGTVSDNSNVVSTATVPDPNIEFIGSPYLSSGEEVILTTSQPYATYTWKKDGTSVGTGTTYTATSAGDYTVVVTLAGIPASGESDAVTVHNYVGFDPGNHNYVMSTTVLKSNVVTDSAADALTIGDKNVSIQYMDGLGRAIQTVVVEGSPDRSHLVQPVTYDQFGRKAKSYLPYVVTNNSGLFQHNPMGVRDTDYSISPQYNFYQNAANVAHDVAPFAEVHFDASPLNRVVKQGAPGAVWQPVAGSFTDHVVRMAYEMNGANEVRYFKMVENKLVSDGYYAAGELTNAISGDENGNETVQYFDKLGRVILKLVFTGDGANPEAKTQYVYDNFGNLSVVLPPEANKAITDGNLANIPAGYTLVTSDLVITSANYSGGSYIYLDGVSVTVDPSVTLSTGAQIVKYGIDADFLDTWAFQYKYDYRQRMSEKRVPGAGWVYMAYDDLDRPLITQDANQREDGYFLSFTKYDVFSRPVMTGSWSVGREFTQQEIQAIVNNRLQSSDRFESIGTGSHGYTSNALPGNFAENDFETVTYYDDYANLPSEFSSYSYVQELGNATHNTNVKGQVVGTKTRILGTDTWLKSVVYYDDRYRVIQTISDHHLGDADRTTTKYDFAGRVLETKSLHAMPQEDINVSETFTYDHASRLMDVKHQVNNDPEVVLVKNEYNTIGELIDKKLHSADNGATFEQSVDYRYNIRGWLSNINHPKLNDGEGDYFGMKLVYEKYAASVNSVSQYNGNISIAQFSNYSGGQAFRSAYTYAYDGLNRLTGADYFDRAANSSQWVDKTQFSVENLTYDLNGNIESLKRYATNTTTAMDDLSYTYVGNQLQSVADSADITEGFKDGNTVGNDYAYDANGNMISDANKDITSISYNHLNLPKTVTFTGGRSISYTYDAAGIKLTKSTNDNGTIKTTDYAAGFIYEDDVLQQFGHAEGRVRRKDDGNFVYDYYLKDHLGNTRITFTTENEQVVYLATMETDVTAEVDYGAYEESLFLNLPATRVNSPSTANSSGETGITNDESARLRGNDPNRHIGPAKLMQVMRGDTVDLEVQAYYSSGYVDNGNIGSHILFPTIISMVSGGAPTGTEGANITNSVNGNSVSILVGGTNPTNAPRAYLNYIYFDAEFNFIDAGFTQVGTVENLHQTLTKSKVISESGFLYVYVSNESNNSQDVYFDDLRITHTKGKVLQEDHYYPFGMNIDGLSSVAPQSSVNNYKYNGFEEQTDFDLGWYDYQARQYDPQLGRFTSVDPAADLMRRHSPYNYAFDNPIRYIDPDGMMPEDGVTTTNFDNSTIAYDLVDDDENIHQTTLTRRTGTTITATSDNGMSQRSITTSSTETITTTYSIGEDGKAVTQSTRSYVEEVTEKVVSGGFGGGGSKSTTDRNVEEIDSNYDLNGNEQAAAFADGITSQLNADSEWNPFNGSITIPGLAETAIVDGGISIATRGAASLANIVTAAGQRALWAAAAGNYLGNKFRKNKDHSGRFVLFNVDKNNNVNQTFSGRR